jgi:hypothetical protein
MDEDNYSGEKAFGAFIVLCAIAFGLAITWIGLFTAMGMAMENALLWALVLTCGTFIGGRILPDPWSLKTELYIFGASFLAVFPFVLTGMFNNKTDSHLGILAICTLCGLIVSVLAYSGGQIWFAANQYFKTGIIITSKAEKTAAEAEKQRQFRDSFDDVGSDDDDNDERDYAYDKGSFHGHRTNKTNSSEYGHNKHHPDDAKLWSVVNDPSANENEQFAALKAIKLREEKRNKITSQTVAAKEK